MGFFFNLPTCIACFFGLLFIVGRVSPELVAVGSNLLEEPEDAGLAPTPLVVGVGVDDVVQRRRRPGTSTLTAPRVA